MNHIKVIHEYNPLAKCRYIKGKACNVCTNDRFLWSLKGTFISLIPGQYSQRLRALFTFTNCCTLCASLNENLLNNECQHTRNCFLETK